MKYVIDRFEENYAILENMETQEMTEVLKELIPIHAREGSVLVLKEQQYFYDRKETRKRKKNILEKFERLKNNTSH